MNTLDTALAYTRLGIRVVPIKPGHKYPGIDNWQNLATDDTDVVTSWWAGDYKSYGIGIATGRTKHGQIFVVDVDDREDYRGSDTLHDLEQRYGALPETVMAITGTGGQHLYFYSPVEVRNDAGSRLGVGLDIRGEGGQVLAAPTLHPNGRQYQWVDGWSPMEKRPANAPQWLLTLLTTQPAMIKPQGTSDLFLADPTTPSARYCAETTWEQLLIPDGWTLAKTDRHGEQHWTRPGKDTRDGISATIGHNGNDALIVFTSTIPWLPEGGYNRFGYMAARDHNGDWKQAAKTYLAHNTTPADTTTITPDEMLDMLVDWKTFWNQDHIVEDWIAKPLIARARQTALFAGAKTGKSWLTLNVVAALATGKPILGHPPTTQVHCLYLDYEMVEADLYERLEQFGYTEDDDLSHLHYALIPSLPPLNTAEGASAIMRLCELTKAEVVVIDTTGRAIEGEENSADSYREFARTTGLALKRAGIACVRTDHAGKDGGKKHGQRGSSAKNDDVDIVYRLDKTDDGLTLERTHTRISWVPAKVELIVEEFDDITTIRLKTREHKGWTAEEIALAKRLDDLGYPTELTTNELMRQAKAAGHKLARRSTVIRAQQCRLLPSPDDFLSGTQQTREPLGTPHQNGNPPHQMGTALGNPPLEPLAGMGTTPLLRSSRGVPAPSETSTHQEILDQDNLW